MAVITESFLVDFLLALVPMLYLVYWYLTNNNDYWDKRGVPNVKNGFWSIMRCGKPQHEIIKDVYDTFPNKRFVGMFWVKEPMLLVRDPDLINSIFLKDFTFFPNRGIPQLNDDIFFGSLFTTNDEQWHAMRYKLTPTFSTTKLKGMFEQISKCGDNMIAKINELSQNNLEIECTEFLFEFSLDVISSCAFGLQFKPASPDFKQFKTVAGTIFTSSFWKFIKIIIIFLSPKLANILKIKQISQDIQDYFYNLTISNLKYRKEKNIERNDYFQLLIRLKEQEESGKDMISVLSEVAEEDEVVNQMHYTKRKDQPSSTLNQRLFTEKTICANTFIFLTTGSKSTEETIGKILLELSRHPNVQQRLQQEVDSVLARHSEWTYDAVKEMTYLDQVIQESQRLYPAIPAIARQCAQAYKVPDSDLVIEKDVLVYVPVWGLHRDPQYYPDPDQFKPERFEENNYRPNPTYLPFGDGPRICIAMRFAVMEMKTCVAKIMSEYSVKLGTKTQLPVQFDPNIFSPNVKGGIWLSFEKRKTT